ncbi:MAG: hypothetical protein NWQ38_14935, partial [Cellulophaga sp.]|nr:hypothetical protein [Cellulophaga sp.]
MKTMLTILLIISTGLFAQAQENTTHIKVAVSVETVVLVIPTINTVLNNNETKVARLYMDKNYKVKKELSF